MKPNTITSKAVLEVGILVLLGMALAGCQDTGPASTDFFSDQEPHSVASTVEREIANGDRNDGMLREQHFESDRLNALGRQKVESMIKYPGNVTIYLPDTTDVALTDTRRHAILAFARDHGKPEADLTFKSGINNATLHPSAPELQRLPKTELGGDGKSSGGSADNSNSTDIGLGGNSSGSSGSSNSGQKSN